MPAVSVVVPTRNGMRTLPRCIDALLRAVRPHDEIIVVDDGSTDDTPAHLAAMYADAVRVVVLGENLGRGPARNRGAAAASNPVVLFVDGDVVVAPDAVARVGDHFAAHPTAVALIGSYDDAPAATNVTSQYRNLLHHHTHQRLGRTATHFWTGLGAVRRSAFLQLGGLDEGRWARNMEDVEFGHRVHDAGSTVDVRPQIRGTHLKRYTAWTMFRSDLRERAIPWTQLLWTSRRADRSVLSATQRWSAVGLLLLLLGLTGMLLDGALRPPATVGAVVFGTVVFGVANGRLWRFLQRARGAWFAIRCVPLHLLHTLASVLGFASGSMLQVVRLVRPVQPGGASASGRASRAGAVDDATT